MSDPNPFPTILGKDGAVPTPPATLRAAVVDGVSATNPGYTANLPASMIEDMLSTEVGSLTVIDAAKVDLINSMTPFGANEFLLTQLGNQAGIPKGGPSNTSVLVVFSGGTPGYGVAEGFVVSDGAHQYAIQKPGGVVKSDGTTSPLLAIATAEGAWSVPEGTVTTTVTSIPSPYVLNVTNPNDGIPGDPDGESWASYRSRVLIGGLAVAQGMPTLLRALLGNVDGVPVRLISIRGGAVSGTWEIIVGGGDPYEVAFAIFSAIFDVTTIAGSTTNPSRNVTVSIIDFPDSYSITFVVPAEQVITMDVLWGSTSTNIVNPAAVAQEASAALAAYVNSIYVGQPMNVFELQATFQAAVADLIPTPLLTRMVFSVSIDGTPVSPTAGTGIIAGDPEGYFTASAAAINVAQG